MVGFAGAFRGAEDVAGREVAGAKTFAKALGLGALADTGGAKQNDAPGLAQRRAGRHDAVVFAALEPGSVVMLRDESDGVGLRKEPVVTHEGILAEGLVSPSDQGAFAKIRRAFAKFCKPPTG